MPLPPASQPFFSLENEGKIRKRKKASVNLAISAERLWPERSDEETQISGREDAEASPLRKGGHSSAFVLTRWNLQRIKGSIRVFAAVASGTTATNGHSTKMTDTEEAQAKGIGNELNVHVLVDKKKKKKYINNQR